MKRDVIIIGGGIAGLCTAYSLLKLGVKSTIIDKGNLEEKTSFGNAGVLSGFEKEPLSYPGVVLNTLKMMIKLKSPIYFGKINFDIISWVLKFMLSANHNRLKKTLAVFEKYATETSNIYENMINADKIDFDYDQSGLLLAFSEKKDYEKKLKKVKSNQNIDILSKEEEQNLAKLLREDKIYGSFLLKRNARLNPGLLLKSLKDYLSRGGVEFIEDEVLELKLDKNKICSVSSSKEVYDAKTFVGATGVNIKLCKKMQSNINLIGGKGYSLTFELDESIKPKVPILLADKFVMITPRENDLRITGKMELGLTDRKVIKKKVESILNVAKLYTKEFEVKNESYWAGIRPLTPNDIPFIGRDKQYKNFVHATGLGWLGLTFAPAIGRMLADIISTDKDVNEDIISFSNFY